MDSCVAIRGQKILLVGVESQEIIPCFVLSTIGPSTSTSRLAVSLTLSTTHTIVK